MICPRCKAEAGDANYCPNCGTDLTRAGRAYQPEEGPRVVYNRNAPPPKRHGCLIVILTLLFLFLVFCFLLIIFAKPEPEPPYVKGDWDDPSYEDPETPPAEDLVTITMEEYDQIEIGMTYDEVREIVGGDGENVSSTDIGIGDEFVMEIYSWDSAGDGFGSATIIVQDGTVISKSQYGLE